MKLIGINGRLRSGKDTAVAFIREVAHPLVVERAGFADKLKLSGVRALGFDPASETEAVELANTIKEQGDILVLDNGREVKSISGREFWQRYGTEAHREVFDSEFWVDALLRPGWIGNPIGLSSGFHGVDVLCITDVRFANEAKRILDLGGLVWKIDAEKRLGPLPDDAHPSEHPLPDELTTCTVPNNGTLEQFQVACRVAYELSV